jgi:hypothetical protein
MYTGLSASFVPPGCRGYVQTVAVKSATLNGDRDPDVLTICVPSVVELNPRHGRRIVPGELLRFQAVAARFTLGH